jgi:hypothetical protein
MKASNQESDNQIAKDWGNSNDSLTTSPSHVKKQAKGKYCYYIHNDDMIMLIDTRKSINRKEKDYNRNNPGHRH